MKGGERVKSIVISTNNGKGKMEIYTNSFFPCAKQKFKKLLNIIEQDFEHREAIIEQLKVYFQNHVDADIAEWKSCSEKYWSAKQKVSDLTRMITSEKYPNGVKIPTNKLKELKAKLKEYKQSLKMYEKGAKVAKRNAEKFKIHLEMIEQGR